MIAQGATAHHPLVAGIPEPTPASALAGAFDLVVVGGGIYGAWTALEAALRGWRTALIERRGWASGTSCRSSKLIHGGLRYLEHGDLGLVRKALGERRLLLRLAPHRVRPLRFLVPLAEGDRLGPMRLGLGLALYDLMAGDRSGVPGAETWTRTAIASLAPFLDRERLIGGASYGDAGTDDAALVCDVVAAAQRAGAVCVSDAPVTGLERIQDRVTGLHLDGGQVVTGRATVLAAGPWALSIAGIPWERHMRMTKGVHLELPPLPWADPSAESDTAVLLTAPQDGRVFFLIPWRGGTMVGTTDTDSSIAPDDIAVESEDITYLLAAVAARCPGLGWTHRQVRHAWAGIRTLVGASGGPSSISREWQLLRPQPGLFIPIGGKLTSARVEAVRMVDMAMGPMKVI